MMTDFKVDDYCVYKTHGVARIVEIQKIRVGKIESECLVLYFEREKLKLTVPNKFQENGDIRRLSTQSEMDEVFALIKNNTKKTKGMWSKRAKEYGDRINSGDIMQTAEVLRDLTRDVDESNRSFSERNIYEIAIYRIASEYAVLKKISYEQAEKYLIDFTRERKKDN
jgi:CarD family transcriptional regulator